MFVPDDARARRINDKLTPAAWLVYESHCARRANFRHKNKRLRGLSYATRQEVAASEGLAVKTVLNAMTELRRKGWIEEEPDGAVHLLVGDFSPVDKTAAHTSSVQESVPETGNLFPDLGNDIPQSGKAIPGLGKEIPDLGNGVYKGSRARSLQPSPATSSTHTPAREGPSADVAPSARVCVISFDDYLGYGESESGITNPRAWAMVHYAKRDADPLVAEWKGRRELVLEARAPDEYQLTPYHVAAQAVASVALVPRYDVAGFIDQIRDVSDETREKLRGTFLKAPAGGDVRARARPPP